MPKIFYCPFKKSALTLLSFISPYPPPLFTFIFPSFRWEMKAQVAQRSVWCAACDDSIPWSTALPCLTPPSSTPIPAQHGGGASERETRDRGTTERCRETKDNHHTHRLPFTPPSFLSLSHFPSCRPSTRHALPSPYPPHHRSPIGGRASKRKIKHIKPTGKHLKSRNTITIHIHMQHTNLPLQLHPSTPPPPPHQ